MRTIAEIQADLKEAKARAKSFARYVGSDMGCDGSSQQYQELRWDVMGYESELKDTRENRRKS